MDSATARQQITPIRPPRVKSAEVSRDALLEQRDEGVSDGSSGL
jgi:hypothetical protein